MERSHLLSFPTCVWLLLANSGRTLLEQDGLPLSKGFILLSGRTVFFFKIHSYDCLLKVTRSISCGVLFPFVVKIHLAHTALNIYHLAPCRMAASTCPPASWPCSARLSLPAAWDVGSWHGIFSLFCFSSQGLSNPVLPMAHPTLHGLAPLTSQLLQQAPPLVSLHSSPFYPEGFVCSHN